MQQVLKKRCEFLKKDKEKTPKSKKTDVFSLIQDK